MIDINNLTIQIGQRVLLDAASAHIADGQKVGIVGENGCGKSTLFRALLNPADMADGTVSLPQNAKMAYVEQTIADVSMTILDYVLSKDTQLMRLRNALKTADATELSDIHEQLKALDSDSAESRIAQILNGLGFTNDDLPRPVSDFSGGWRMRLSLAGALFQYSDILLLDEPTNHLDLEASIWLEAHLKKYKGTLLLISHDRMLLNRLSDYILHFDAQKLVLYHGNYDTFEQTRRITRQQQQAAATKIAEKRAHMQAYIDRFRYKASKAKQAQSRIKMLEKMQDVSVIAADRTDSFTFPKPERLLPPLITLDDVSTGYGEHVVLRRLNMSIGVNERIALLGKNGNGKSTLAKLLDNKLPAMTGKINRLSGLKIGYFAQHQEEELPLENTPVDYFQTFMRDKKPSEVRSYLAQFGIDGDKALTKIGSMSGGEKARLIFARIALDKPALLILDEPTNHLDMKGRDALLEALNAFEGSVILITHDFNLIELFADELWLIDKNRCQPFAGDLDDYRLFLLDKVEKSKPKPAPTPKPTADVFAIKLTAAQVRQIKAKIGQVEREISVLTHQKEKLHQKFETPLTGDEIQKIQKELNEIDNQLETLEIRWLELSEQIM